jgi:hypothetical protein
MSYEIPDTGINGGPNIRIWDGENYNMNPENRLNGHAGVAGQQGTTGRDIISEMIDNEFARQLDVSNNIVTNGTATTAYYTTPSYGFTTAPLSNCSSCISQMLYNRLLSVLGMNFLNELAGKSDIELLMIKSLTDVGNMELSDELKFQLKEIESGKKYNDECSKELQLLVKEVNRKERELDNIIKAKINEAKQNETKMEDELEKALNVMAHYKNLCEMYETSRYKK